MLGRRAGLDSRPEAPEGNWSPPLLSPLKAEGVEAGDGEGPKALVGESYKPGEPRRRTPRETPRHQERAASRGQSSCARWVKDDSALPGSVFTAGRREGPTKFPVTPRPPSRRGRGSEAGSRAEDGGERGCREAWFPGRPGLLRLPSSSPPPRLAARPRLLPSGWGSEWGAGEPPSLRGLSYSRNPGSPPVRIDLEKQCFPSRPPNSPQSRGPRAPAGQSASCSEARPGFRRAREAPLRPETGSPTLVCQRRASSAALRAFPDRRCGRRSSRGRPRSSARARQPSPALILTALSLARPSPPPRAPAPSSDFGLFPAPLALRETARRGRESRHLRAPQDPTRRRLLSGRALASRLRPAPQPALGWGLRGPARVQPESGVRGGGLRSCKELGGRSGPGGAGRSQPRPRTLEFPSPRPRGAPRPPAAAGRTPRAAEAGPGGRRCERRVSLLPPPPASLSTSLPSLLLSALPAPLLFLLPECARRARGRRGGLEQAAQRARPPPARRSSPLPLSSPPPARRKEPSMAGPGSQRRASRGASALLTAALLFATLGDVVRSEQQIPLSV